MYVPAALDRVKIAGRGGIFIVVNVNYETEQADVVSLTGKAYLEENVPFSAIRPYEEEAPPDTK